MASSSLQKLLRNQSQSTSKILTYIRQPFVLNQIPQISKPNDATSFSNHTGTDCSKPDDSISPHFYPSFPFGFFIGPINPTQSIRSEPEDETAPFEDDVIRADSVKKKRKKKMNKHKLRKLRKRLARKTKT